MDHILITSDKLKLMLSCEEMAHYKLSGAALEKDSPLERRLFAELLDDVKAISGFDAADDKIFIQLYPSRDGGAEIYITRLTGSGEKKSCAEGLIRFVSVAQFSCLTDMMRACVHMCTNLPRESSAWEGDGSYYLILEDQIPCREYLQGKNPTKSRGFLGDYGKIIADATANYYVKEHCLCFCEKNAVKILSSMI